MAGISNALRLGQAFVGLIYPLRCLGCGRDMEEGGNCALCNACFQEMRVIGADRCLRCARPLGPHVGATSDCVQCRGKPLGFRRALAAVAYQGPARQLIHEFKYRGSVRASRLIGDLLVGALQREPVFASADLIMPVPLHWRRQLRRGFNQAAVMARILSRRLAIRCSCRNLVRLRATPSQTGFSIARRWASVEGVFRLRRLSEVAGKRILLIDDVMTTCATCSEAGRALRRGGAREVLAVVAARTP